MIGDQIEKMIERARRGRSSDKHMQRQKKIDQRRAKAIKRIGEAARTVDQGIGQNREFEHEVVNRMQEAMHVRVSQAEALADLAERKDFISRVSWWEISEFPDGKMNGSGQRDPKDKGVLFWKGYVVQKRTDRRSKLIEDDDQRTVGVVDISVRMTCTGEIVAAAYIEKEGKNVAVGISEGDDPSADEAVDRAVKGAEFYFSKNDEKEEKKEGEKKSVDTVV